MVDMGETMVLTELVKPIRYAFRVHGLSVILRKRKTVALIVFTELYNLLRLPCSVLFQH